MKDLRTSHGIPVTVITGYLGAGKTTLLRNLLEYAQRRKLRLAVVMNEFGQVGIDGKLVKGRNVQLIELSGGCVCCSMSGEFEAALKELLEKAKPEHIVIETTGVAEPDAIVVDLGQMKGVRLDAVVTVADGDSLARFPTLGRTGRMQLEMADLVLLNKTDLVNKKQLAGLKKNIGELNSHAAIVECVRCQVAPEMVLGAGSRQNKIKMLPARGHGSAKTEFFVLETKKVLDKSKFEEFAAAIPSKIYRAKGFVNLVEGKKNGNTKQSAKSRLFLWNFVAGRSALEQWRGKEDTHLVFIGGEAKRYEKKVSKALEECEK